MGSYPFGQAYFINGVGGVLAFSFVAGLDLFFVFVLRAWRT